jgi:hypothetical protein
MKMEQISTPLETLIKFLPYLIPVILLELVLMIIAVVVIFIQIIGPIVYFIIGREE